MCGITISNTKLRNIRLQLFKIFRSRSREFCRSLLGRKLNDLAARAKLRNRMLCPFGVKQFVCG
jgi:hypothetical protein